MQAILKPFSILNRLSKNIFNLHDVDFWLQQMNPLWSTHQALGKIIEKDVVAKDTVSLVLKTNRHVQHGKAGQHHPIIVTVNGRRYERTYSLTQLDDQHLRLTVKKVTDGVVSGWLIDDSRVGDMVGIGQPYGEMQHDIQTSNILLLAAGSGITPMLSLLQAFNQSKKIQTHVITLLYWVKTHQDAAYVAYLEQLATLFSNFRFQIFYTQEQDTRLNQTHVDTITALEQTTVYACGPSGFVSTAETIFQKAAFIQTEAFSLSQMNESDDTGFVNISLSASGKTFAIPKGQSILTSLEQQGLKPDHGCRMGICNKCVCTKTQGHTKNLLNGSTNQEPSQVLKICVNSAQSDLVIEL